uniref:Uncharacterized protein n=1 Tax=Oryza glaberrima TaxID=4538 RepID=I1QTU9_ORYGL
MYLRRAPPLHSELLRPCAAAFAGERRPHCRLHHHRRRCWSSIWLRACGCHPLRRWNGYWRTVFAGGESAAPSGTRCRWVCGGPRWANG